MYATAFNRVSDTDEIRQMVAEIGAAELITTAPDGYPQATLLPIIWAGDLVLAHMARANQHWTQISEGAPVLLVCAGAQAYVSPGWYASKRAHGKVVPTWNYSSVHLRGTAHVHDDPAWLRGHVTTLTDHHEHRRAHPWQVTDAPDRFIESQLRGIIGIEIRIQQVDAKAKLSQNRSSADRHGVIDGLSAEGRAEASVVAAAMQALERGE
jgi:transcriptional regulator